MRKLLVMVMSLCAVLLLGVSAYAVDGTMEGAQSGTGNGQSDAGTVEFALGSFLITPFESVSLNESSTWQDNRLRAYWSSGLSNVNGFLLFDVSDIPDSDEIISMTLRCYLENAFGSPANNPVVDVYYSGDDGWTRGTVVGGQLSLDLLLADDVPFGAYTPSYDFVLDVDAHDWSTDLADNQICIGLKNDVSYYSYVYFFGAYGEPSGPPPELSIETTPFSPIGPSSWSAIKGLYR